jgi:hypothetical protein
LSTKFFRLGTNERLTLKLKYPRSFLEQLVILHRFSSATCDATARLPRYLSLFYGLHAHFTAAEAVAAAAAAASSAVLISLQCKQRKPIASKRG